MRGIELIKKFIASGLTEEERFELEKLALDDDFLADAWEGLSNSGNKNSKEILLKLSDKIDRRKGSRIVPIYQRIWPFAIAASLALIVAVSFLLSRDNSISEMDQRIAIVLDEDQSSSSIPGSEAVLSELQNSTDDVEVTDNEAIEISKDKTDGNANISKNLTNTQTTKIPAKSTPQKDKNTNTRSLESENSKLAIVNNTFTENPVSTSEADNSELISTDKSNILPENQGIALLEEIIVEPPVISVDNSTVNERVQQKSKEPNRVALMRSDNQTVAQAVAKKPESITSTLPPQGTSNLTQVSREKKSDMPKPAIGFEAYKILMQKNSTITRENLFMLGIKEGFEVHLRFKVDSKGVPDVIEILNISHLNLNEKIIDMIKKSGAWNNCTGEWTFFEFPLVPQD